MISDMLRACCCVGIPDCLDYQNLQLPLILSVQSLSLCPGISGNFIGDYELELISHDLIWLWEQCIYRSTSTITASFSGVNWPEEGIYVPDGNYEFQISVEFQNYHSSRVNVYIDLVDNLLLPSIGNSGLLLFANPYRPQGTLPQTINGYTGGCFGGGTNSYGTSVLTFFTGGTVQINDSGSP